MNMNMNKRMKNWNLMKFLIICYARKKICIEISIEKSKFNAIHNRMIFQKDNSPNINTVQWKTIIEIVRFLRFVLVYVSDGSRALLHH